MKSLLIVTGFIFCWSTASLAQNLEYISLEPVSEPKATVDWREVYGRVSYKVRFSVVETDAKRSLESYLKTAVKNLFGNENGSYILTLSVHSGNKEIAKKAIVSFNWSESKFLFFTRNSDIKSNISFSGHLVDHFPVTSNNNRMQAKLELHRLGNISLDTETYNKFSEQVSLLQFEVLQPAISIVPALEASIEVMATLLNESEKEQLSSDVSMRFIDKGGSDPNSVTFSVRGPKGRSALYNNGIFIDVILDTDSSIVGSYEQGKFKDLDLNFLLQKAMVGATGAGIPFVDALSGEKYKEVRSYLFSLDRGEKVESNKVGVVCRELWDTLGEFYTTRDAPAIYAALLSKYEVELDVSGAKRRCLDKYKITMDKLEIPHSNIVISQ